MAPGSPSSRRSWSSSPPSRSAPTWSASWPWDASSTRPHRPTPRTAPSCGSGTASWPRSRCAPTCSPPRLMRSRASPARQSRARSTSSRASRCRPRPSLPRPRRGWRPMSFTRCGCWMRRGWWWYLARALASPTPTPSTCGPPSSPRRTSWRRSSRPSRSSTVASWPSLETRPHEAAGRSAGLPGAANGSENRASPLAPRGERSCVWLRHEATAAHRSALGLRLPWHVTLRAP
mmetsp:Transcript_7899/g.25898  ORF Transcript_7899/g.25898 Transcript_7899/m.25898 type:complete len:233 (+) Transcript_7899:1103-1801(+)